MTMSFLDDARELGKFLPPSHVPSDGEIKGVVGALALLVEHGVEKFQAVKGDPEKLHNLLSTGDPDKAPETPNPEVQAQHAQAQSNRILELEQQVQNLIGLMQQTHPDLGSQE